MARARVHLEAVVSFEVEVDVPEDTTGVTPDELAIDHALKKPVGLLRNYSGFSNPRVTAVEWLPADPLGGRHSCIVCGDVFVHATTIDNHPMRLDPTPTDDGELSIIGDLLERPVAVYGDDRTPRYNRHECRGASNG